MKKTTRTYLKAKNSLHTTQIFSFEYVFIAFSKKSDAKIYSIVTKKISLVIKNNKNIIFTMSHLLYNNFSFKRGRGEDRTVQGVTFVPFFKIRFSTLFKIIIRLITLTPRLINPNKVKKVLAYFLVEI